MPQYRIEPPWLQVGRRWLDSFSKLYILLNKQARVVENPGDKLWIGRLLRTAGVCTSRDPRHRIVGRQQDERPSAMVTTILNLLIFGLLTALVVLPVGMLLRRAWQERKARSQGVARARR